MIRSARYFKKRSFRSRSFGLFAKKTANRITVSMIEGTILSMEVAYLYWNALKVVMKALYGNCHKNEMIKPRHILLAIRINITNFFMR